MCTVKAETTIRGFYTYPNPKLADAIQGVNRAVKSRTRA